MIRKAARLLFCCLITTAPLPAGAETIKVAGSGGMIPLVAELAKAYMKKNPADQVMVDDRSRGMVGGILEVRDGAIDIGMTAKRLSKEMRRQPVTAYEIARVAVEFGVNSSVTAKDVTDQQICDIRDRAGGDRLFRCGQGVQPGAG